MRIINRKEFMDMPEGTVFMKYEPHIFGSIYIKVGNVHDDFIFDRLDDMDDEGYDLIDEDKSFEFDLHYTGRDGMFNKEQLFCVYENKDVIQLIERLQSTLK